MRHQRVPINQAAILFYLKDNPDSEQKDMKDPLGMSSNVICNAMRILVAERFVEKKQLDRYGHRKTHKLTEVGEQVVQALCEST